MVYDLSSAVTFWVINYSSRFRYWAEYWVLPLSSILHQVRSWDWKSRSQVSKSFGFDRQLFFDLFICWSFSSHVRIHFSVVHCKCKWVNVLLSINLLALLSKVKIRLRAYIWVAFLILFLGSKRSIIDRDILHVIIQHRIESDIKIIFLLDTTWSEILAEFNVDFFIVLWRLYLQRFYCHFPFLLLIVKVNPKTFEFRTILFWKNVLSTEFV